jgi:hypothetical protein
MDSTAVPDQTSVAVAASTDDALVPETPALKPEEAPAEMEGNGEGT